MRDYAKALIVADVILTGFTNISRLCSELLAWGAGKGVPGMR